MPVIGYLSTRSPDNTTHLLAGFRQGLAEGGFIERQNVTIKYHWGARPDDIICAGDGTHASACSGCRFNRRRTRSAGSQSRDFDDPVVFATGADPVKVGLVESYNRPGGNATGINFDR